VILFQASVILFLNASKANGKERGGTMMILRNVEVIPTTDPSGLIRLRDSMYAADLFTVAASHLRWCLHEFRAISSPHKEETNMHSGKEGKGYFRWLSNRRW